jgi:hypothetical protein
MIAIAAAAILIVAAGLALMKWKPAASGYPGSPAAERSGSPGSLDKSFIPGTGANEEIRALAIQADEKILVGGSFTFFGVTPVKSLARLDAGGQPDGTFKPGMRGAIRAFQ